MIPNLFLATLLTSIARYIITRQDYKEVFAKSVDSLAWKAVHDRLVGACLKVWEAVSHVLCHDSPEGHNAADGQDGEYDFGVKDTLSYCWRALKEARYRRPCAALHWSDC